MNSLVSLDSLIVITDRKFAKVMFLHVSVILPTVGGGRGVVYQHAPQCDQTLYISSCTGDLSQLVTEQHTGNIKCMMG